MKQNKQIIYFFLFFVLLMLDSFAIKNQTKKNSFVSYLSHPATLFCTGLASLGGYCFYNKESSFHAYEWLKQRFDETPSIVKWCGVGLGALSCYTFWYYKKLIENNDSILKNHDVRIRAIATKDHLPLHDMTKMLNRCFMRLSNLEQITLGYKVDTNSFGVGVPIKQSKVDRLFENHEEALKAFDKQLEEDEGVLFGQGHSIVALQERTSLVEQGIKEIKQMVLEKKRQNVQVNKKRVPQRPSIIISEN